MNPFLQLIKPIKFYGKNADKPLAYRHYNSQQIILGKTMEEHLKPALSYWHGFNWSGQDSNGDIISPNAWQTITEPMPRAIERVSTAFEFIEKLGLKYFTFHDRDIAPEEDTLRQTQDNLSVIAGKIALEMQRSQIKLLWGAADLFSHHRYKSGAATNPDPQVFAYAIAQVKKAFDITHQLNGANFAILGGREGYDTLLNTNLAQELDQLGRFLSMLVDYKYKIGFKGILLIETKPCEPTKHQFDYDSATLFSFLQKYNLENEFKVSIEANQATLAGHSFPHEAAYGITNTILGGIDINQATYQQGWDTQQFPTYLSEIVQVMYLILHQGSLAEGGFNFDTKLRRQRIHLTDMLQGIVVGIDTLAHALINAANLIETKELQSFIQNRYNRWQLPLGESILQGNIDFEAVASEILKYDNNQSAMSDKNKALEYFLSFQPAQ